MSDESDAFLEPSEGEPGCYLGAGHAVEALKAFEQAAFVDKHVAEIEARKVRVMYAEHRAMQSEIEQ